MSAILKKYSCLIINNYYVVFVAVLVWIGYRYFNNILHIRFVDEEENIVGGYLLLKGASLYSDVFIQHQPLAYILSGIIQAATKPDNLFILIRNHRIFMIILSFFWAMFLYIRFGKWVSVFIFLFELVKIYLFGNLFLAESIIIYPLIYIVLVALFNKTLGLKEWLFFNLIYFLCLLTLATVWPLLIFCFYLVIRKINIKKGFIQIFYGVFLASGLLVMTSDIRKYFYNIFYLNFFHYIPHQSSGLERNLLKVVFPYFDLINPSHSAIYSLYVILSISFISMLIYLVISKQHKLLFKVFIVAGLSNIRYVSLSSTFYQGFHGIIWFGVILLLVVHLYTKLLGSRVIVSKVSSLILLVLLFATVINASFKELLIKRDISNDYYINYSRQFDFGEAINDLKKDGDRLFQYPDEILLFWQAKIPPYSSFIYYYPWMFESNLVFSNLESNLYADPPEFVYTNEPLYLDSFLKKYKRLKRDGNNTQLYLREDVYEREIIDQQPKLKYLRFEFE